MSAGYPDDVTAGELAELEEVLAELEAEEAAGLLAVTDDEPGDDGPGTTLASDYDSADVIEMTNAAAGREAVRQAEDAAEVSRRAGHRPGRPSAEERLASAARRIGAGSYLPASGLFGDEAREQRQALARPGKVTGRPNCGPSGPAGYCMNSGHASDCGSLASTEIAEALISDGAYTLAAWRPMTSPEGRPVLDRHGQPATLAEIVEASTGQRVHGQADFETGSGRPPLASIGGRPVIGDYDDPAGNRTALPDVTGIAAAVGLAGTAARAAQRQAWQAEHDRRVADRAMRGGPRAHPDHWAESPRERAERIRGQNPRTLVRVDEPGDGLTGALPAYTYQ